jgi:hypothetical protein
MRALENVEQLVNCSNSQVIIFDRQIIKNINLQKVILQKNLVEGKYMDVIALSDIKIVPPAFEKFS